MFDIDNILKETINSDEIFDDELPYKDSHWVTDCFMVSSENLPEPYNVRRFSTVVENKFTDTSLGGNISLNCFPQFTRYADPRIKGMLNNRRDVTVSDVSGGYGMGRFYGEVIDDNSTNVFFEFGLDSSNNILFYLLSAVDYKKSVIANSARSPFFYNAGWVFGTGALFIAFPIIGPILLLGILATTFALNMAGMAGRFEHFYLKPTMFLYWSTVNSLVTMMATELGILSPVFMEDKKDSSKIGAPLTLDQNDLNIMKKLIPGLITSNNAINVHAMVARTQILYNKAYEEKLKLLEEMSNKQLTEEDILDLKVTMKKLQEPTVKDLWDKLKNPIQKDKYFTKDKDDQTFKELKSEVGANNNVDLIKKHSKDKDGRYERDLRKEDTEEYKVTAVEVTKAIYDEGARYAVFRVNYLGSSSETFNNNVTNIDIGDKINSLGQKWRTLQFNLGGVGNIPGLTEVTNAVLDFAAGSLSGVTLGLSNVVASFLSGASIEVQKRWSDSSITLPTHNFSMDLVSDSPHPMAQLRNIYIPLAAIIAGCAPLSTGPRSYTAPYRCSMFVRGHQRINYGMITSVTITRGTTNLAFNRQRRPLAVKVDFVVTDFSQMVSAPIVDSLLSSGNVIYDDESGISKYIQALCARDLYTTVHVKDKAIINLSRVFQSASLLTTPEYWGSRIGDMLTNSTLFSIASGDKATNYSEMY